MDDVIGSICLTCLSTNRHLMPLQEHKSAIEDWTRIDLQEDYNLCWECDAIFKRIYSFKMQVLNASTLFNQFMKDKITTFSSFSKLKYITNTEYNHIYNDPVKEEEESDISDNETVGINIMKCEWSEQEICTNKEKFELESFYSENYEVGNIGQDDSLSSEQEYRQNNVCVTVQKEYEASGDIQPDNGVKLKVLDVREKKEKANEIVNDNLKNLDKPKVNEQVEELLKIRTKQRQDKVNMAQREETKASVKLKADMRNIKVRNRYIVVLVNEEEMLRERQKEKECARYIKTTYKCDTCILGYVIEEQYLNHKRNYHSDMIQVKCPICECTFSDQKALDDHKGSHYQIFLCTQCTFTHIRKQNVLDHFKKVHLNQEYFTCSRCQMKFGSKKKLIQHRVKAHVPALSCKQCGKEFFYKHALKQHMLIHTGMPEFQCQFCKKFYRGKGGLANHINKVHRTTKAEDAYCAKCDLQFKRVYTYEKHMKLVHTLTRVECEHCGKQFKSKSYLSRHLRFLHSVNSKRPCRLCTKSFDGPESLKRHIKEVHENKKTAICDICQATFTNKERILRHLNNHIGSGPYKCDKCSSTFKQQNGLYMHTKLVHAK